MSEYNKTEVTYDEVKDVRKEIFCMAKNSSYATADSIDISVKVEGNDKKNSFKNEDIKFSPLNSSPVRSSAVTKNTEGIEHVKIISSGSRRIALVLITIAIITFIAVIACLAFLFAEIAKLKSEKASFNVPSSQQNSMIIQQLNHNISMLDERITEQISVLGLEVQDVRFTLFEQLNLSVSILEHDGTFPASSCAALPPSSPSGYYWVRNSIGSAVHVYCDMTRSCGNVTGGWMRVAELNSSHQCPSNFKQHTVYNKQTCTIANDSASDICSSVIFPIAIQYSSVCGRIKAYQIRTPDGFNGPGRSSTNGIDSNYVDGVSLTRGSPRQHVWTFAADNRQLSIAKTLSPPSFVASNNYFCNTGRSDHCLWDGAGCVDMNTCCTFNNPPWFYKQLSQLTADDIEMRVCRNQPSSDENIAIEIVEIYTQ